MTKQALLILDDLDNLLNPENNSVDELITLLKKLLTCRGLKIVATSRLPLPASVLHYRYDVPRMKNKYSISTFDAYAYPNPEGKEQPSDLRTKDRIIKLLDGYPFPIRLAGSYVRQTKCSLNDLWDGLNKNAMKIYQDPTLTGEQNRDTSLRITLEFSYNSLLPQSKTMFRWLAFFPSGILEEAAKFIFGQEKVHSWQNLVNFSMAELSFSSLKRLKRYSLPEPARDFAEKISNQTEINEYASKGLKYYYRFIQQKFIQLSIGKDKSEEIRQILLEKPNIQRFLQWGYTNEKQSGFSYSARITALLTDCLIKISSSEVKQVLRKFPEAEKIAEENKDFVAKCYIQKSFGDIYKSGLLSDSNELEARRKYLVALQELTPSLINSQESLWERANTHKARGDIYFSMREWENAKPNYLQALKIYESLLPEINQNLFANQGQNPLKSEIDQLLGNNNENQSLDNSEESYPKTSVIRKVIQLITKDIEIIESNIKR